MGALRPSQVWTGHQSHKARICLGSRFPQLAMGPWLNRSGRKSSGHLISSRIVGITVDGQSKSKFQTCANCRGRLDYHGRISGCRGGSDHGFQKQNGNRRVDDRRPPHRLAALAGLCKVICLSADPLQAKPHNLGSSVARLNLRHVVMKDGLLAAIIPCDGHASPIDLPDGALIIFISIPANAVANFEFPGFVAGHLKQFSCSSRCSYHLRISASGIIASLFHG